MGYFRDVVEQAEGYVPGEQPKDVTYVKLNTNENPYPPSPKAIEAIQAWTGDCLRRYPDPLATDAREAAARLFSATPANVLCANGSDDILSIIIRAVVEPGQAVAITNPTYSLYETLAAVHGAEVEVHECRDDFTLPVDELAASTVPLVIVSNPNAPTGLAAPTDELARIARGIDGLLVVDEAYVDFAEEDAMRLARSEPNVLVVRTLSKAYSLAGIRFGLAVGRQELIDELAKVRDSYPCDSLSIAAAAAALEDQASMQQNVVAVRRERARLIELVRRLGFEALDSQANFVLARPPDGKAAELYEGLKSRGILIRYFNRPRVDQYVRISVGTTEDMDTLETELERIYGG